MAYTIANMKLGDRLTFGRYSVDPNAEPAPITWLKASDEGDFISEFCVEYCQYDATENVVANSPRDSAYYRGSASWQRSNLRQFLNSAEEDWYTPSHPFDAPPIRREFGTTSIQSHRGFLEYFEPYELEAIVKNGEDYIRLPTMEEIIHERFPLFKRKGIRAVASPDLLSNFRLRWRDMSEYNYMTYWTITPRDPGYMTTINRSAHTETFNPSSHCGVRPVFRIRTDTPVDDSNGAVYFLKASVSAPDLITTRIFEFLGI